MDQPTADNCLPLMLLHAIFFCILQTKMQKWECRMHAVKEVFTSSEYKYFLCDIVSDDMNNTDSIEMKVIQSGSDK